MSSRRWTPAQVAALRDLIETGTVAIRAVRPTECAECPDTGACNGGPCAHPKAAPTAEPTEHPMITRQRTSAETQEAVAYRIRAELVCCDSYQKVHDAAAMEDGNAEPDEDALNTAIRQAVKDKTWHDICYWAETSARIAEGRCLGYEITFGRNSLTCGDLALEVAHAILHRNDLRDPA